MPMSSLTGKVALITGAARGIGWAIARKFHVNGCALVLADQNADGLRTAASDLDRTLVEVIDLAETSQLQRVVDAAINGFGRLDILVNNAGVFGVRPSDQVTLEEWNYAFAVNLVAPFFLSQAASRVMRAQGSGCIINVTSVASYYPRAEQAAYCASKAALEHLTRVLALEYAASDLRVNALRPGAVDTGFGERALGEEAYQALCKTIPLGRTAALEQIAEGALYLATAEHMTGQALCIDGGQSINVVKA